MCITPAWTLGRSLQARPEGCCVSAVAIWKCLNVWILRVLLYRDKYVIYKLPTSPSVNTYMCVCTLMFTALGEHIDPAHPAPWTPQTDACV